MITNIIRIVIVLIFIELNAGIYLGIKRGVKVLHNILEVNQSINRGIQKAAKNSRLARAEANQAAEMAQEAQKITESQLRVRRSTWRNPVEDEL